MRKFFALALAVAMVLSLASVSFAVDYSNVAGIDLEGPFRYSGDSDSMKGIGGADKEFLRYGEGTYYMIKIADEYDATAPIELSATPTYEAVSNYGAVEKLKAKAEFEMGEELVDSISIVKKYVDLSECGTDFITASGLTYTPGTTPPVDESGYYYFVEFKVVSKETTSDADIVGTIEFNRKADDEVKGTNYIAGTTEGIGKIDDVEVDFQFNVFYADTWLNADSAAVEVTGDLAKALKYDTNYALKFSCDDEVEIPFGKNGEENEGTFTVDVSGQGKVFLKYNTKANEAICAANPGVDMFFLNFNNCKFNRVGEFVYEMDDIAAAYKVVGDQLVEIKGAEMDADSVTFNTRVLESYVFATAELVNPAAAVEAPVVEAPAAVTNPSTGA